MQRATLSDLSARPYDVLVVGGGIYGAMAARESALRGFRTALVERDDFGGGTSYNSLKIMHGGIRYVQNLDVARLRASARERAFWCRAASDLVRPLDFVIPLFGHGLRGPAAFAAAAAIYTALSTGLRGPGFGGAGIVGVAEARRRLGDVVPDGLTGGGVWRDGQISDANRLQLAVLQAATDEGADIANYVEVDTLLRVGDSVCGAGVTDRLSGATAEIAARVVVSCAGDASERLAETVNPKGPKDRFPTFVRAMNLVLRRSAGSRAVGIVGSEKADAVVDRGGRMYFLTPWAGRTIVGTHETALRGSGPDTAVADFLHILNRACPRLSLTKADVLHVYDGVIPADVDDDRGGGIRRRTRGSLIDHSHEGLNGLISLVGVKYTTARMAAAQALDLASAQLRAGPDAAEAARRSLLTVLPRVDHADLNPSDEEALTSRIRTAIRDEMAMTFDDILWRRTRLGETGATDVANESQLVDRASRIAEAAGVSRLPV